LGQALYQRFFIQKKLFRAYYHYRNEMVEKMTNFPLGKARGSKRVVSKRRASVVVNLNRRPMRHPCLVLDSSKGGFRLRGSFEFKRGQIVELIIEDESPTSELCRVVWVGKAGSKQEGEIGLETV
jgi:PilZ domain